MLFGLCRLMQWSHCIFCVPNRLVFFFCILGIWGHQLQRLHKRHGENCAMDSGAGVAQTPTRRVTHKQQLFSAARFSWCFRWRLGHTFSQPCRWGSLPASEVTYNASISACTLIAAAGDVRGQGLLWWNHVKRNLAHIFMTLLNVYILVFNVQSFGYQSSGSWDPILPYPRDQDVFKGTKRRQKRLSQPLSKNHHT